MNLYATLIIVTTALAASIGFVWFSLRRRQARLIAELRREMSAEIADRLSLIESAQRAASERHDPKPTGEP